MDWPILIALSVGVFSILSVNIGLFLYLANKIDSFKDIVSKETKDFHGRLCSLEARWHGENKPKTDP